MGWKCIVSRIISMRVLANHRDKNCAGDKISAQTLMKMILYHYTFYWLFLILDTLYDSEIFVNPLLLSQKMAQNETISSNDIGGVELDGTNLEMVFIEFFEVFFTFRSNRIIHFRIKSNKRKNIEWTPNEFTFQRSNSNTLFCPSNKQTSNIVLPITMCHNCHLKIEIPF